MVGTSSPSEQDTHNEHGRTWPHVPKKANEDTTTAEVSDVNGQGEHSMMGFIQTHMSSILKPFAEHVDDILRSVGSLQVGLTETNTVVSEHKMRLEKHTGLLAGIRKDLDSTRLQFEALQSGLDKCVAEKSQLETDHANTKAGLGDARTRLETSEGALQELQTSLRGTRSSVSKLREGLGETDRNIARSIEPAVQQIQANLKRLEEAHQGTAGLLDKHKHSTDNFHEEYREFTEASASQQRSNETTFRQINAQLTTFGTELKDTNDRIKLHVEDLANTNNTIQPMKMRLETLDSHLEGTNKKQNHQEKQITDLQVQCNGFVADLAKLFVFYEEVKEQNIFESFAKLKQKVNVAFEDVNRLSETSDTHSKNFHDQNDRLTTLDDKHGKLQEQVDRLDKRVGEETLDDVALYAEGNKKSPGQRFIAVVQQASVTAKQKSASVTLKKHTKELEKQNNVLAKTCTQVEAAEAKVEAIEDQLKNAMDDVKRLTAGLDLTQEYWKGLSKGFKETNRSINSEGEVLPSKGKHIMVLPPLGTRPPSRTPPTTPGNMTVR